MSRQPVNERTPTRWIVVLALTIIAPPQLAAEVDKASIQFQVRNHRGDPLPCRIHLLDAAGNPQRATNTPFWHDHFICSGNITSTVAPGEYTWEIQRGPEFDQATGAIKVAARENAKVNVTLRRFATLFDEGWYSGDLHVHRPVSEIKQLMQAEDLNFAPVIDWWNTPAPHATRIEKTEFQFDKHRIYCTQAGEDERQGGALLYFGLKKQLDLSVRSREVPSPMYFVSQAKGQDDSVWIDIEKPFWWDVPTWLASGQMHSIGIAHNHMHRSGVLDNEAWGKSRDGKRFPGVKGNGLWTQHIYYHILNTGLRLPPSAGSASGVLPNPVGYNRVYVQLEDRPLNRNNWFAALRAGRCFVTNGPLLRVQANGSWPGSGLKLSSTGNVKLQISLSSQDPISHLEVVSNGRVLERVPCTNELHQQLHVSVNAAEPGWLLVRAIADVDHTFRFASTAPWYIETENVDGADVKTRISRASVQFFLDWLNERIQQVNANVPNTRQRESIMGWHIQARRFWGDRLELSNAE